MVTDMDDLRHKIELFKSTVDPDSVSPYSLGCLLEDIIDALADHPVEVQLTDEGDIILCDETGARIATFADGHIRTGAFDSAHVDEMEAELRAEIGTKADVTAVGGALAAIVTDLTRAMQAAGHAQGDATDNAHAIAALADSKLDRDDIVVLTDDAYEALPTKDPDKIYMTYDPD